LLVKKKERGVLIGAMSRDGHTVVPLDIHFNPRGLAKVTLGVAEGRQKHDKRHAIAARDWQRDKARLLRNK
jgi:SsrA-binding protein